MRSGKHYNHRNQSHLQDDQLKAVFASLILVFSVLIFLASILGYFSELTYGYKSFLLHTFGKYNKWNDDYGPQWFVVLMGNFTSLGSGPNTVLFLLLISIYLYLRSKLKLLKAYLLVIIGGGIFSILIKTIFSAKPTFDLIKLLLINNNEFPSGHAMISVIFYMTSAYFFSKSERNEKIRTLFFSVGIILPFIIGISRIFLGAHSPNQVIAGWAVGYFWISFCWLIGIKISRKNLQFD